ncbi:hypothetical protein CEXT_447581 [Caerostris extrusa]|uniref:Uncharacterized protein n=1 Tax=Caerostris extrusa TaxID=172846 RepID=A0AAV4VJZ6_CAEEX|nr:hypothetical protein CEXT_447581 [Caerostris extrusa]
MGLWFYVSFPLEDTILVLEGGRKRFGCGNDDKNSGFVNCAALDFWPERIYINCVALLLKEKKKFFRLVGLALKQMGPNIETRLNFYI